MGGQLHLKKCNQTWRNLKRSAASFSAPFQARSTKVRLRAWKYRHIWLVIVWIRPSIYTFLKFYTVLCSCIYYSKVFNSIKVFCAVSLSRHFSIHSVTTFSHKPRWHDIHFWYGTLKFRHFSRGSLGPPKNGSVSTRAIRCFANYKIASKQAKIWM